jgi:hypothetical protein
MSNPYIGENIGQNHAAALTLETWHGYGAEEALALAGKNVLILGAGIQRWEDFLLHDYANSANVINLDPIYGNEWSKHEQYTQFRQYRIGKQLCAIAQSLPIGDESVDAVFSTWSAPLIFLEDIADVGVQSEQIRAVAEELYRVIRHDGIVSLCPISTYHASMEEKQNQANFVLRHFRDVGFDCGVTEQCVENDGKLHRSFGLKASKK